MLSTSARRLTARRIPRFASALPRSNARFYSDAPPPEAEDKPKKRASFQEQLANTTARRIKAEKEQEEQWAKAGKRAGDRPMEGSSRSIATIVGELLLQTSPCAMGWGRWGRC